VSDSVLFTVGVFQDVEWAGKGLQALRAQGFGQDLFSFLAKDSPDTAALGERTFGVSIPTLDIRGLGVARARGPIVDALQMQDRALEIKGIAATASRIGFQQHDGRIYEVLVDRGGLLVAVTSDARAADALAIMHSYGGGNAAIGAWNGRV
jgi:hypothetical protein